MASPSDSDWVAEVFPTAALARGGRLLPVGSRRRALVRGAAAAMLDTALRARNAALRTDAALDRAAERAPRSRVTMLGIYQPDGVSDVEQALGQMREGRHDVRFILGATGPAAPQLSAHTVGDQMTEGKFANLNRLLDRAGADESDWYLLLDDDVILPPRFLDRLLGVAEALEFDLCQPAQSWRSHAAWRVTRRRAAIARRTRFVEVGPVTLMRRAVFETVTPFSGAGMGWGQCLHWGALAKQHSWRLGIVDALAIRHERRPTASAYREEEALTAARAYLADREHLTYAEAAESGEAIIVLPDQAP